MNAYAVLDNPRPLGVGRVGKQRTRGAVQRHVHVHAGAGAVAERLGHEGGLHPAALGQHREQIPRGDDAVGGGECVGVGEVLLELPVAVLVVVGVVAPTEGVHRLGDLGQVVVHPGHVARFVTRLSAEIGSVGGDELAVLGPGDEEVFDLGADVHRHTGFGCLVKCFLEDQSRGVWPRLSVDVRIAVHQRQTGLDERDGGERGRIGNGDQVRVLGHLPHSTRRVAGGSRRPPPRASRRPRREPASRKAFRSG